MNKILRELLAAGQSAWLDDMGRGLIASGELQTMIVEGLRGATSNPTIFAKAIAHGSDYDAEIAQFDEQGLDTEALFWKVAIRDVQDALDLFRPVYEATEGTDGFVSLEVSPRLAHDSHGTIVMAKDLWQKVDRPNLMIKIPGTTAGAAAIEDCTAAGLNINVTLVFSVDTFDMAARAYVAGLQARLERGDPIDTIASANSLFVSRIDSAIDTILDAKIARGESLSALLGEAGVATARLCYQRYLDIFDGADFAALRDHGAHAQRPLWASTGTKNPAYAELKYVESLIGANTINTLPRGTLAALLDHGIVRPEAVADVREARATAQMFAEANISLEETARKLQDDGIAAFNDSFTQLLDVLAKKTQALRRSPKRTAQ
ncbi:MAG: transaldolase [Candidatus Tumulicola sp.]